MNVKPHILIVDEAVQIQRQMLNNLPAQGYRVSTAANGRVAWDLISNSAPDLIVLELILPDLGGEHLCQRIRKRFDMPILVLSSRCSEIDKVIALDAGADDFLVKPFGIAELLARLRALLRRKPVKTIAETSLLISNSIELLAQDRIAIVDGREIRLTPKEFVLLKLFVNHTGKVIPRALIAQELWGPTGIRLVGNLRILINQLRNKIEIDPDNPRHVITIHGFGYRFED